MLLTCKFQNWHGMQCYSLTSLARGPNWIHGSSDNPVLHLAKETKTLLHVWDEEQAMFDADGRLLDADEANEFARLLWDNGAIADAFRYSNQHHNSIDSNMSLFDFFVEKANSMFEEDSAAVAKEKRKKFLQAASVWGTYVGSHVTRQSMKNFWLEECIEGENPFVRNLLPFYVLMVLICDV